MDRLDVNRRFYDALWRDARLERPERFNTWPLVERLAAKRGPRLEIGPGLRPRLPVEGSTFVDASLPAARRLRAAGAHASIADAADLPFASGRFALVAAFDLIEHHPDDRAVLAEIERVLARDGCFLCAVPLHASAWNEFDDFVGHYRRYEPDGLAGLLAEHGFAIEQSAVYGMQPRNRWLLRYGMWMMQHQRERAMYWYNKVGLPLTLFFQQPLRFQQGLLPSEDVDEVVLVCRRRGN